MNGTIGKTIAVFGGNGFLGKRICQAGIQAGFKVISLSRSGAPPKIESHHDPYWISQVDWQKAEIFKPETYKHKLANVDSVVHSIGILFENQAYKKVVNSNYGFLSEIKSAMSGSNPMNKNSTNTYEAINRDSALVLADAFLTSTGKSDPSFVYISADSKPLGVPEGYISTKREAEFELGLKTQLRTVFMRPGFMYDDETHSFNLRDGLKTILQVGNFTKDKIFQGHMPLVGGMIKPPVSTQQVSRAVVDKILDDEFSGVFGLEELRDY